VIIFPLNPIEIDATLPEVKLDHVTEGVIDETFIEFEVRNLLYKLSLVDVKYSKGTICEDCNEHILTLFNYYACALPKGVWNVNLIFDVGIHVKDGNFRFR
jgi:hypothetical protein